MNKKVNKILIIAVTALVLIGLAVFILRFIAGGSEDTWICENGEWIKHGNPSATKPTEKCENNYRESMSPKQVVSEFYTWVSSYEGSPVADGAYKNSDFLTDSYKNKVEELVSSFDKGGYDPLICAQDKPQSFMVGNAEISDGSAQVLLEQTFDTGKRVIPIELVETNEVWQINDIRCDLIRPQQGLGTETPKESTIVVYYNNEERLPEGETDCGIVYGVERVVPEKDPTVETKLNSLFKGPSEEEQDDGYTSFFSSETADILISVNLMDDVAYVNLKDIRQLIPNASISCGSQSFLAQIEESVKHGSNINNVLLAINGSPETIYNWLQIGCTAENNFCSTDGFK